MNHKGFTLIELMIVVAIIGILVAVGMPQYQNYVARSQVAEGFSLASGSKTALAEYYATHGKFPDNGTEEGNSVIGVEAPTSIKGKYVEEVTVSDDGIGAITVLFGSGSYHDGRFLRLTAIATDGAVRFPCTTDIEEPYRPKDCEEGVGDTGSSEDSGDTGSSDDSDDTGSLDDSDDPGSSDDSSDSDDPDLVPWTDASGNGCWSQEYADGAGAGNGWVVGDASLDAWQSLINTSYAPGGYGKLGETINPGWECK